MLQVLALRDTGVQYATATHTRSEVSRADWLIIIQYQPTAEEQVRLAKSKPMGLPYSNDRLELGSDTRLLKYLPLYSINNIFTCMTA